MYINTFSTLTFSSHFNVVKYSFFSYYLTAKSKKVNRNR